MYLIDLVDVITGERPTEDHLTDRILAIDVVKNQNVTDVMKIIATNPEYGQRGKMLRIVPLFEHSNISTPVACALMSVFGVYYEAIAIATKGTLTIVHSIKDSPRIGDRLKKSRWVAICIIRNKAQLYSVGQFRSQDLKQAQKYAEIASKYNNNLVCSFVEV